MESCRLPIELCETVMNTLPDCYESFPPLVRLGVIRGHRESVDGQRALCACALTCRAWRVRAQYLLSTFPRIRNDVHLALFTMAVQESPITALTLGGDGLLDPSKASELFMRSCPRLQHFRCIEVRFDNGPPLRLLRMRLPFFASITILQLWECIFQSFRAMMDVVWACPNLALLEIGDPWFKVEPSSAARFQQMYAAVEHLRACQKLTTLHLDMDSLLRTWGPTSAGLSGVGRVFGCAVMELYIETTSHSSHEMLGALLRDSFPALHSVTVASLSMLYEEYQEPPWLHIIPIGRPIPGRLKKIVLEDGHKGESNHCCKRAIGTSEKVVGSEKSLPELLSGLEELTIRLDGCEDLEKCARYIWSVLPGMRDVLRFEYCPDYDALWLPYTLPATT